MKNSKKNGYRNKFARTFKAAQKDFYKSINPPEDALPNQNELYFLKDCQAKLEAAHNAIGMLINVANAK